MKTLIIVLFLGFALTSARVTLYQNEATQVGHGAFKRSSEQNQSQSQK